MAKRLDTNQDSGLAPFAGDTPSPARSHTRSSTPGSSRGDASRFNLAVACGSVPCDTVEGRRVLQGRLALLAKACGIVALALFVFGNLIRVLSGSAEWRDLVSGLENPLLLVTIAMFAVVALVCQRASIGHRIIAAIDYGQMGVLGVFVGLHYWIGDHERYLEFEGIAAVTNILLLRCVIVPSCASSTLGVCAATLVPLIAGYALGARGEDAGERTAIFGAWAAVTAVIGTAASYVIYGLRQEVEEARQFGQYTVERRIGSGGMGEVFKASHSMLRRPTALKLLRHDLMSDDNLARFEREVQLTSSLTHPNTIAIYDFGRTPEGQFYYAMEYLDGVTLEGLVRECGPQPPSRVIHIVRQVCASLAEAHGTGIIHRDIKPANIILCQRGGVSDVAKVVDFGLVKDLENRDDVAITGHNTIAGTPLYVSPESIRGGSGIDGRSDLYAVGALAYYLLTGTHLFESQNIIEIYSHHLNTTPQAPSERLGTPLPADLERLVLRCLEKDASARPENATALIAALDACDDAGAWSDNDASAWWIEHGARVTRCDRGCPEARKPSYETETRTAVSPPLPDTIRSAVRSAAGD